MAIIDLAGAKELLKLNHLKSEEDAVLKSLVDEISAAVEDYCGRKFVEGNVTEEYDGSGSRNLMLRNYPINSVASVTRTKEDSADTQVTVESAEYKIDSEAGMLIMHPVNHVDSSIWIVGDLNYSIVYNTGYAATDMPKAVINACKTWIAVIFQKANQSLFAIQSSVLGGETVTFSNDDIPPQVKLMLNPWRKLR